MSVMYRLVCVDCAEEVWLGDIHLDKGISKDVDVVVPDWLNSANLKDGQNSRIMELGYFLVQHAAHKLTFVNEFALATFEVELESIGSKEYLVHLADINGKPKAEIFKQASVFPEGLRTQLQEAATLQD